MTEEIFPGFKFSVCSYVVSLLRPEIIRDLDLPRHGLEILPLDGTFTPMPNGDYLWRVNDHGKTHREIARHSKVDAEAYDEFGKAMQAMCRFVKPILSMVPPDPTTLNPKDLAKLLFLGRRFQGMTGEDKYNQVQLMTMSAIDFLDQWFETDVLKATMSASGIIGTFLGVRSPGTAYVLLHHYMGEIDGAFRSWGFSRGGTGAISNAIADAARELGVEIRTEAGISQIIVKDHKAKGVVLSNGDEIYADVISSSVDPRLTFTKFIDKEHLPGEFLEDVNRFKYRGSSGKVNMALDGLPDFKCLPGVGAHLRGAMSISPSVEYMEKAYDDAKYGNFSRRPYIDMVIPSLTDPSVAPPGKHVMSCFVQYAPYKLRPGLNWDDQKEAFGNNVIDTIAEYAPNIKNIILHKQVVTPLDLERDFGLSEGNIFQGELSLEQLFFLRPVPGGRSTARRSRTFTCADRPRIPAAASWAPTDGWLRSKFSKTSRGPRRTCPRRAMSSSSAAATTDWSPLSIWPRPDTSRWCSNAVRNPAARPSPTNFIPASAVPPWRTRPARCVRTSSATCSWRNTG